MLSGTSIAITGATGLIGSGLATHFARPGMRLCLSGRDTDRLAALGDRCRAAGADVSTLHLDLCDQQSIAVFASAAGDIDVLINNAADVTSKPFLETDGAEISSLVATNVTGMLLLTRLLTPSMVAQGRGTIVNCSSLAGYKCNTTQTVYSITKSAVNAASEALRAELEPRGIKVVHLALSSVSEAGGDGAVSLGPLCARIETAIERGERDVFLSPVTRVLMRLYAAVPLLKRMRP